MRLHPALTLPLLLLSFSITAHADDLFTLSDGAASNVFTLPSSPTPDAFIDGDGFGFVGVPVSGVGDITVLFFDANGLEQNGGIGFTSGGVELDFNGPQLFNGPESAPTFIPGLYSLDSSGQSLPGPVTFQISDESTAVTPEPSSLILLGTGILGAAGAARRKFSRQ